MREWIMENLIIEATKSSPAIRFYATSHLLEIIGESYPENAAKFYAPMFSWLEEYLETLSDASILVNLEIVYFNSSSSKVLMNFFDMLEEAAAAGRSIIVNWRYHEENETALECGEEFMEDLEAVTFKLVGISDESQ